MGARKKIAAKTSEAQTTKLLSWTKIRRTLEELNWSTEKFIKTYESLGRAARGPQKPEANLLKAGKEFDKTGEVALQVDGEGAYSVTVSVRNLASPGMGSIGGIEPAEIQVRESTGRQVFEIRIPKEALRQAVEQAATRRRRGR